jgi:protoheme IX farnesyltransferase
MTHEAVGIEARVRAARGGARTFARYLELTKPKQTALLMATAIGAYLMSAGPEVGWLRFGAGMLALFAAISGSTALNMVIDRDIDAVMERTAARPLPSGALSLRLALGFALGVALGGLALAWWTDALFGVVTTAGLVFDVVIYSMWLKRRTAASILIGGISGGMPAIAGRALAIGTVDPISLLLAAGVVLWIPAHILTLAMRHVGEYQAAGVPVWPAVHGERSTRRLIAAATAAAAAVLFVAGALARIHLVALAGLALAGVGLSGLALVAFVWPSERRNWTLFKTASVYMLFAFSCLTVGAMV